jgi:hypothetical protein
VHRDLKRKHVTLSIVWEEYIDRHPDGYAAQILRTDDGAMPARAAILRSLQWVASGGASLSVRFTTCLIFLAVSGLRPGGRVASFNNPFTPLAA